MLAVFAPSREETRILLPELDDDAAARALAALGPSVIQKRGADGVFVVDAGARAEWRLPALATMVVDPTGAGDASVGAIGAALLAGGDLLTSASSGLRTGALAVSGHGAGALCPALAPAALSMEGPGPVTVTGFLSR
jgi:sugar/nucleoside kinase (ribokinase family)